MMVVILVRGKVGLSRAIKDTLSMLKLDRKNACVIIDDNPSMKGMVQKVKDRVTWGEVNEETSKLLKAKMYIMRISLPWKTLKRMEISPCRLK